VLLFLCVCVYVYACVCVCAQNTKLSVPCYELVAEVFGLEKRGWFGRQATWMATQIIEFMFDGAINEFLNGQVRPCVCV